MSPETTAKLELLRNRRTRYEVVIERADGSSRSLLGYTIHKSRTGLASMIHDNAARICNAFGISPNCSVGFQGTHAVFAGVVVRFTARTLRDCILQESELQRLA